MINIISNIYYDTPWLSSLAPTINKSQFIKEQIKKTRCQSYWNKSMSPINHGKTNKKRYWINSFAAKPGGGGG